MLVERRMAEEEQLNLCNGGTDERYLRAPVDRHLLESGVMTRRDSILTPHSVHGAVLQHGLIMYSDCFCYP
ncbi:unnamed protein product [Heligmosomoides polygyrus]|uniref:Uncharacterized protein n=1 Tax=Heligmosomoides polygyrus TaxID=6339 RepID=A0A3P7U0D2_HELPZ|nr:unnamed protein product [Heligmosomoides polygyrus]